MFNDGFRLLHNNSYLVIILKITTGETFFYLRRTIDCKFHVINQFVKIYFKVVIKMQVKDGEFFKFSNIPATTWVLS